MKNKLILTGIALLVLLNVASFFYGQANAKQVANLTNLVSKIPDEPIVYVGKDGYTPKKGIDYRDGDNGANGINAISFIKTTVQEMPLIGNQGPAGKDGTDGKDGTNGQDGQPAPTQEMRVNPNTGDIETKLSDGWVWKVLVKCEDYKTTCGGTQ